MVRDIPAGQGLASTPARRGFKEQDSPEPPMDMIPVTSGLKLWKPSSRGPGMKTGGTGNANKYAGTPPQNLPLWLLLLFLRV